MSRARWTAGVAGGLAGGVAGVAAVNRAAVRRLTKRQDRVDPNTLLVPPGTVEHLVPTSDGWHLGVLERGPEDGVPVVLLHGITLSARVWPYQLADLPKSGFRVFALDMRGHGQSVRLEESDPAPEMTLDRMASDVFEVLQWFGLDRIVLVGHSMGGMVALRMMERDADLAMGKGAAAGLVLAASSANPTRRRGLPGLSDVVAAAQPVLSSAAGLAARLPGPTLPAYDLAFLVARATFGKDSSPSQVLFTGALTSEVPVKVSAGLLLEIVRFNAEDVLAGIEVPAAVIVGDHDLMTPPRQSEYLAAHLPDATLTVLEGCGHQLMLERPEELHRAVVDVARRAGI